MLWFVTFRAKKLHSKYKYKEVKRQSVTCNCNYLLYSLGEKLGHTMLPKYCWLKPCSCTLVTWGWAAYYCCPVKTSYLQIKKKKEKAKKNSHVFSALWQCIFQLIPWLSKLFGLKKEENFPHSDKKEALLQLKKTNVRGTYMFWLDSENMPNMIHAKQV